MKFCGYAAAISVAVLVIVVQADPTPASIHVEDNNECEANGGKGPCDHDCHNLPLSYRCSCEKGYFLKDDGTTCQETTCDNGYFRCSKNGKCIRTTWICDDEEDCEDGEDEKDCPAQNHECEPKCLNRGICNADKECECAPGWTGKICQIRECEPKCENGGRCNAKRECECASGWKGNTCEVKDCYPRCEHGGECKENQICEHGSECKTNLTCTCQDGWRGDACQFKELTCDRGYFKCASHDRNTIKCIPEDWKCDNENDCDDGADEGDCPVVPKECPDNEIPPKQCLNFIMEKQSWNDAKKYCEDQSSTLVTLADPKAFQVYLANNYEGEKFWIGGSDRENEGVWEWVDGTPFVEFPWEGEQPDNKNGKQHCLAWGSNQGGVFDDKKCEDKRNFICQH